MRRSLVAIDARVLNDDRLSDAEYRLLARMSLTYGTKMFNADETSFHNLRTSKSAFYRLTANLVKLQYLQHISGSSQYSIPVSLVGLKSPRSGTEIPTNETENSQKWELEETEETEEKRTKREDKEEKEEYIYNNNPLMNFTEDTEIREKEKTIENPVSKDKIQEKEKRKQFVKPTLEEVQAYCRERESTVSAHAFYDWYESNGWRVGKNPMKDWKAAIRTWEAKDRAKGNTFVPTENRPGSLDDDPVWNEIWNSKAVGKMRNG